MRLQNIQAKQKRNYLLAGGAAIILLVLLALIVYQLLVVPRGKAFDFFTIWFGVRNIWQRQDPYNWSTTQSIQREMFGKVLPAEKKSAGIRLSIVYRLDIRAFCITPFLYSGHNLVYAAVSGLNGLSLHHSPCIPMGSFQSREYHIDARDLVSISLSYHRICTRADNHLYSTWNRFGPLLA